MRRITVMAVCVLAVLGTAGIARAGPPAGADRWALLIGLDHFAGKTRPNTGAVGDVADVGQALAGAGWPSDHVRVLTDGAASAAAIRDGLRWLVDHSSDNSHSVFFYSGHVKQSGSTEFLWPYDNQFISDREVADQLRQLRGWAWIVFSGCEAAGFDEGISSARRLVTASSRESEKSYELPPDRRNSVFTGMMVDEAILQRRGDANHDGRVSVNEAFNYAADQAPRYTAGQVQGPQHPVMAGGDGSEWFLEGDSPAGSGGARRCLLFLCV